MRWQDQRESENVEDRRGLGPARIGGGLGIGGIVLVLAVSYFTGMFGHRGDPGAHRIAGLPQVVHKRFELGHDVLVRCKKWIVAHGIPGFEGNLVRSQLAQVAMNDDAMGLAEPFPGNRRSGNPNSGLPGRRPPAAPVVADAVLLPVGVIGMARAERVDQISVVFTSCIFIADQQRNRCAGRLTFKDAGQDFDPVGFLPLGHVAGRAGFAAIQILLDIVGGQHQTRRATIDDAPDGRAVAFAKGRHGKDVTKGIAGHDLLHEVELDA